MKYSKWDEGVEWYLDWLTEPEPVDYLELAFVRDQHLRVVNGSVEDDKIQQLIDASLFMAERRTERSILIRGFRMVLSRFPTCEIRLDRPPLISVGSITYIDPQGGEQVLDPAAYAVTRPTGPQAQRATIRPAVGETWPRRQMNAVTVTYTAGYTDGGSPVVALPPVTITEARLLIIGESYKQRSMSVHAFAQQPALISAFALLDGYRVY